MTESPLLNRWIENGQLQKGREWLLRLVQVRFPGALTPDVVATINAQPSLPLLETWLEAAGRATTYEDFVAVLRQ